MEFIKDINFNDVLARTLKTFLQALASALTVGALVSEIQWVNAISVALVAGLYAFLMNVIKYLPSDDGDITYLMDEEDDEPEDVDAEQ